jgi:hypothetical protein
MLPNEPGGFAVNLRTGEVHKRHAWHAVNHRRTTAAGVDSLLHGRTVKLCSDCFPPAPKPKSSTRFVAEPVKVIEPKAKAKKPELDPQMLYADRLAAEVSESLLNEPDGANEQD